MIETKLMLDAKQYIGRPDLTLCNGARISFVYEEIFVPLDRRAEQIDFCICSGVFLSEYVPPRYRQIEPPALDDLPF